MVIGNTYKFGFIIERIREWEASSTYQSGIVFLFLDNTIYPDTVRNTTLNVDLYHLTRDDNPFMNPAIDPDLYELEKDMLFKTLYAEDMEKGGYKYVWWELQEIGDAGFEIFSVSNGKKIKIFGAKLHIDDVDLLNMVELDLDEYLSIANELKNYVDHGYEEGYKN